VQAPVIWRIDLEVRFHWAQPILLIRQWHPFVDYLRRIMQKLKPSELLKLKKQAEEGLEWKFILMKPVLKTTGEIDIDKLKSIYPVSIQIGEFHESLHCYDMDDVFTLIPEEFMVNTQGVSKPASGAALQSLFSPMS